MHRPLATTHTGTAQDTPDAPGYPRIPSKKSAGNPMIPQHDSCSYRSFALPVARPPLPSTTPRRHTITVPRSPRFALPPSLRPTLCQRIHLSIDCWAPIRMHTHGRPPNTHTLSLSLSHPSLGTTVSSCGAAPLSGLDIKPHRRAPDACMHEDRPRRQRCFTWSRIHTVLCLSTIQLMHRHTPGASIAAAHGRISEIWKFLFWRAGE